MKLILHSPPRLYRLLEDTEWLASEDFLKAAEHSALFIGCLATSEVDGLPLRVVEGLIHATSIHILLILKLSNHPDDSLKEDLRIKIDAAINVYEQIGDRRPSGFFVAFLLKLLMTRKLGIRGYFDEDDPPPDDLEFDFIHQGLRSYVGFADVDDMLRQLETLFGSTGRYPNTVKFMQAIFRQL